MGGGNPTGRLPHYPLPAPRCRGAIVAAPSPGTLSAALRTLFFAARQTGSPTKHSVSSSRQSRAAGPPDQRGTASAHCTLRPPTEKMQKWGSYRDTAVTVRDGRHTVLRRCRHQQTKQCVRTQRMGQHRPSNRPGVHRTQPPAATGQPSPAARCPPPAPE